MVKISFIIVELVWDAFASDSMAWLVSFPKTLALMCPSIDAPTTENRMHVEHNDHLSNVPIMSVASSLIGLYRSAALKRNNHKSGHVQSALRTGY